MWKGFGGVMKALVYGLLGMIVLAAAPSVAEAGGDWDIWIGVGYSGGGEWFVGGGRRGSCGGGGGGALEYWKWGWIVGGGELVGGRGRRVFELRRVSWGRIWWRLRWVSRGVRWIWRWISWVWRRVRGGECVLRAAV